VRALMAHEHATPDPPPSFAATAAASAAILNGEGGMRGGVSGMVVWA
jgi:hypothetical protein